MFDTRPVGLDIRRHSGLRRWLAVAFGTTLLAFHASSVVAATRINDPAPAARTMWTTLAPKGEGFSIEVPGQPEPASTPGKYVYAADDWAFFVKVDSVTDTVREFVEAEERGPIRQYLATIRKGLAKGAIERTSSEADFDGYPSLRFSVDGGETHDKQPLQGEYWLLVTDEHFYLLMALGPKGTPNTNADRFLGSFRLDKARAASVGRKAPAATSPTGPLAAKLSAPMLAVALLITEERLNAKIDQTVQDAPPAKHLGSRWNATSPAWQKARTSFTSRIAQIAEAYDATGEMGRTFDAALARVAPGSQADALGAALDGPTGPEILREYALMEFISTVMADDPDGPKPGERAWAERSGSLAKTFNTRLGSMMPRDAAREAAAVQFMSTAPGTVLRNLWSAVVGQATTQIVGAVNLVVFDDCDAIGREIEEAVASVK